MVYENCKVYGPYERKDGRKHVVVIFSDGKRKTVSFPKYLLEKKIERYLKANETVDHYDRNVDNNEFTNLTVLPRQKHAKLDAKCLVKQSFICPVCRNVFSLSGRRLSEALYNRKRGKTGPFCSRTCVGIYGSSVQNGERPFEVSLIQPKYSTHKQLQSLIKETL